jgi:radical SAM superfamily enzyme with C-terminal helix-hairpin-helix motif
MKYTILDSYTDEPAGLGVPPYLGTYPRYIYGALRMQGHEVEYLTIDDVRLQHYYKGKRPDKSKEVKTNIKIYNLTHEPNETREILDSTEVLVVVGGVQTPGTYLSAMPGTFKEVNDCIGKLDCKKVLAGPGAIAHGLEGGKKAEKIPNIFNTVDFNYLGINEFDKIKDFSIKGAELVKKIPYDVLAELETGKGCVRVIGCSFCTEPIKNKVLFREEDDVIKEAEKLSSLGIKWFRIGKQTDFYSYKRGDAEATERLLKGISSLKPEILHIDNCDPARIKPQITEQIVKYCTPGNVAAFGVESFDREVVKRNNLNVGAEMAYDSIKHVNDFGSERGSNGMPKFLPGINIIFGLMGENKQTHQINMQWLKKIYDDGLMIRRINIRQVVPFPGTRLFEEAGTKFVKKNKAFYWKWRNEIRQNIDFPMLKRLVPLGTILKDVRMEIYDGNTTFGRQIGTYPLVVGVKGRLELNKFYDVSVTDHMLRSITGKIV